MRNLRRAVDAYYASRGDAPVWIANGQWTPAARAAFERLQRAPDDGLDLRAFRVYSLDHGPDASLALGDVALSEAVAAYAFQASGGRVDPARISRLIGSHRARGRRGPGAGRDLESGRRRHAPCNPIIRSIRAISPCANKLARSALGAGDRWRGSPRPTSRRGAATRRRSGPRRNADLESDILTNMEFWRWLPRDLGADRIMVNIPEFTARLYRDNALALPFRVITGKPDKPTPLFSDRIEYLIVNPSWNVPQSIIRNEMLPKLDALRAQGYEIRTVNGRLTSASRRASATLWGRSSSSSPMITPSTCTTRRRATCSRPPGAPISHGCVRVDQPFKLAETLLRPERGWSEERLRKMVGKTERRVSLPEPLPIHIVYFTMTVDENGRLQRFEDIYGYGRKAREQLGLGADFGG